MELIHRLCTRMGHPLRRLMKCEVHLDGHFSRARWYRCWVCGQVFPKEEE